MRRRSAAARRSAPARRWRKSNSTANSVPQSRKNKVLHPLRLRRQKRRKLPVPSRNFGRHRRKSRPNAAEKLRLPSKSMKLHKCRRILRCWNSKWNCHFSMPIHKNTPNSTVLQNTENYPQQRRKRKDRSVNSYSRDGRILLSASGRRQRRRHRSRQEPNSECSSRSCRKPHKRQRRPPNAQ